MKTQSKKSIENTGISERVLRDICMEAEKYNVTKVVLFGSRARGTHWEKAILTWQSMGAGIF